MKQPIYALIAVLCMLVANNTFAHQLKAAETTVLFNKQSNQLEVMHRFYLHDTEHAVQHLFDKKADIIGSKETQHDFANYVATQFFIKDLANNTLALNDVGFEVDGKFFWVYQETKLPTDIAGLKLFNGALRELWPTQVNMVNIEGKGEVKTLYFTKSEDWLVTKF